MASSEPHQPMCTCAACSPIINESICTTMAQTMTIFAARNAFTANQAMDHNNLVGLQFQAKGIGELSKDRNSTSDLAQAIASFGAVNQRVAGMPMA